MCLIHRKVLILLEVTVLKKGSECPRYGDPVQYDEKTDGKGNNETNQNNNRPSIRQNSG